MSANPPIPPVPAEPPQVVPEAWVALLDALPAEGRVIVIGQSDTGKSTFAWWLARELERRGQQAGGKLRGVAIVDADVGQSRVGPPATVGLHVLGDPGCEFYFVGAVAPDRRPASVVRGTLAACRDAAARKVAWTVVDTTGYVSGEVGVTLKVSKIRHLRPAHVVALGEPETLQAILEAFAEDAQVTVHRLDVAAQVRAKPTGARTDWRREAFGRWLAGGELNWIEAAGREFVHAPAAELYARSPARAEELKGLLVGFSDAKGRGIALGLLHSLDLRASRALIRCPEKALLARRVDFGCIRLEPDGSQVRSAREDDKG